MKTVKLWLVLATTTATSWLLLLESVRTVGFVTAFRMNNNHHHNHNNIGRRSHHRDTIITTATTTTTIMRIMKNDNGGVGSACESRRRREAVTTLAKGGGGMGLWLVGGGSGGIMGILTAPSVAAAATTTTSTADVSKFQKGPGGILYEIIKEGTGPSPVRAQQVKTEYSLWTGGFGLTLVDSSKKGFMKGPLPVIVGVGRVIPGWDIMLLEMKVGEVRRMIIPPTLGYGERGMPGSSISPNATLYFQVEILDMQPMPELTDEQQQWLENNPLRGL
jgi:hypothetical protein